MTYQLIQIDRDGGEETPVDNEQEAITRIAKHLNVPEQTVTDRLEATGWIDTDFSRYERRAPAKEGQD